MATAKTTTTTRTTRTETVVNQPKGNQDFLFDKSNYMWMLAGVAFILIGLALMAGGKSPDPHKFNYDDIYSFRRITLAPIMMLIGFGIEIYAIMKKPVHERKAED
jgi:hypothetical protein